MENDFVNVFKTSPEYHFKAPARINLIGEHIDYNGGYVFPCCINKYIYAYVSRRKDDRICLKTSFDEEIKERLISNLEFDENMSWEKYPFGVFYILAKHGYKIKEGLNIFFTSEIPMGSGLSSSAALLDLTTFLVNKIYNFKLSRKEIALMAKEVENDYCHLKSGIMDQAVIALGERNKGLLLDCSKFEYKYKNVKLPEQFEFVVLQTNKPRQLIESQYNQRVIECQAALEILQKKFNINNIAELSISDLKKSRKLLKNKTLYKRVRHIVSEQQRVNDFVMALEKENIKKAGLLLNESHDSLQEDYQVTGKHLDALYYSAKFAGAVGARMTGAGFGGCAIAIIYKNDFVDFCEKVKRKYKLATGIEPDIFEIEIVDGVSEF